jgi:hypothetical protein
MKVGLFLNFSDSLLLVYRNTTDFWKLMLDPETVLNSFINPNSFMIESLGFSIYIVREANDRRDFGNVKGAKNRRI